MLGDKPVLLPACSPATSYMDWPRIEPRPPRWESGHVNRGTSRSSFDGRYLKMHVFDLLFFMLESRKSRWFINSATLDVFNKVTVASFTSIDSHRYFPDSYRSLYKIVCTSYIREDHLTLVICEEIAAGFVYCGERVVCRRKQSRYRPGVA